MDFHKDLFTGFIAEASKLLPANLEFYDFGDNNPVWPTIDMSASRNLLEPVYLPTFLFALTDKERLLGVEFSEPADIPKRVAIGIAKFEEAAKPFNEQEAILRLGGEVQI